MSSARSRVAVIAILLALIGAALAVYLTSRADTVRADDEISSDALTGRELGIELGLEPVATDDVKDCEYFAEYVDGDGFCLDTVASNKFDAILLGKRIGGHLPSEQEREYIELSVQLTDLMESKDASPEEIQELSDRVWEMHLALVNG